MTPKGQKIMRAMKKEYKNPETAKKVFYASRNAGRINEVDKTKKK